MRARPRQLLVPTGRNIRHQRKRLRITQPVLAERAGTSLRTISRIENGKADLRLSTVEAIAEALGIAPDALLDRQGHWNRTLDRYRTVYVAAGWEEADHGDSLVEACGANLRFHRRRHEFSQLDLAHLASSTITTISDVERGRTNPKIATLGRLARGLRIEPLFLLRRPEQGPFVDRRS